MFVEIKRGGVTMYTNNQLEVIHLQDSYTIMYALLAREIMNESSAKQRGDMAKTVVELEEKSMRHWV